MNLSSRVPAPGRFCRLSLQRCVLVLGALLLFGSCTLDSESEEATDETTSKRETEATSKSTSREAKHAEEPEDEPAADLDQLHTTIEGILEETKTPAAGVALITADGTRWADGFGMADVTRKRPATPETVFRLGSVSKLFVALTTLRLVERDEIDLSTPVLELVPDLTLHNPYAPSKPVRLVHLLEHTSGLDDIHFAEYAIQDPDVSIVEGLERYTRSRVVRWEPGYAMSYSNAGPAMVAAALERRSEIPFETLTQREVLNPLGMTGCSWRPVEGMAQGYRSDDWLAVPYAHILMRPSGALNCSPQDMLPILNMLVERGMGPDGEQLWSPDILTRMEHPQTTASARKGSKAGYGLGNYTDLGTGYMLHGHDGGIDGFLAHLRYLPGVGGWAVMVNREDSEALNKIAKELRLFALRDVEAPKPEPEIEHPELSEFAGYWIPQNHRLEITAFIQELLAVSSIAEENNQLSIQPLLASKAVPLTPVGPGTFRRGKSPIGNQVFLGTDRVQHNGTTSRRVVAWVVWGKLVILVLALLTLLMGVVSALFWYLPRVALRRSVPPLVLWAVPALAAATFWGWLGALILPFRMPTPIKLVGFLTPYSAAIWLLSWSFAVATLACLGLLLKNRKRASISPWTWTYALLVAGGATVWLVYLSTYGVIGIRTWAL